MERENLTQEIADKYRKEKWYQGVGLGIEPNCIKVYCRFKIPKKTQEAIEELAGTFDVDFVIVGTATFLGM